MHVNPIHHSQGCNVEETKKEIDGKRGEFIEPRQCYKTDQSYQNIANFSELEKLKDYLLL